MSAAPDTQWARSFKGNRWRRINGIVLAAGVKRNGGFWAQVDGTFVDGNFHSLEDAMSAAEAAMRGRFGDWGYQL